MSNINLNIYNVEEITALKERFSREGNMEAFDVITIAVTDDNGVQASIKLFSKPTDLTSIPVENLDVSK